MTVGHPFVVSGHRVNGTLDAAVFLEWATPLLAAQPLTTTVLGFPAVDRLLLSDLVDSPDEPAHPVRYRPSTESPRG